MALPGARRTGLVGGFSTFVDEGPPPVNFSLDREYAARSRRQLAFTRLRRGLACAYLLTVGVACAAWVVWGCLCDDPAHGNPNPWNVVTTFDGSGLAVHECGDFFTVSRQVGVPWCCALGGGLALHLYLSLPVLGWIWRFYSWYTAARALALGVGLGLGGAFLLYRLRGFDPPPGFGLDGVPTGAALMAGLGAALVFFGAAGAGYWRNAALGVTMMQASAYLLVAVGVGTFVSFSVHVGLGFAVAADMLFVLTWATQVFVTLDSRAKALLGYLMPLVVGAALGGPLEAMGFGDGVGLPRVWGLVIGAVATFLACVALSAVFERRGFGGVLYLTAFLLVQVWPPPPASPPPLGPKPRDQRHRTQAA